MLPRILAPLRIRDFALLWSGMTVSLLGDRFFLVALAWETYSLSNRPLALGLVTACMTAPVVLLLALGGVLTDRFERRHLMISADVLRAASIGVAGWLAVAGTLRVWELAALVAVSGAGSALFLPAFGSIVPEIVPQELLPQANALDQFVRPAVGLVGPALGGVVVATAGAGWAFVADAASFGASTAAALALTARPMARTAGRSFRRELAEGYRFVRRTPWLAGGLLSSFPLNVGTATSLVLLPFIVKNGVHGSARDLGFVYSAGAVGALAGSFALGQRGLPRRHVAAMYAGWTASLTAMAGYGLARNVPTLLALALGGGCGSAVGTATWGTMMHTLVPRELLGRVYSLDWLSAYGIVPVINVAAGVVASAAGARPTLVVAAAFSGSVTLLFPYLWPGMRDSERDGSMRVSAPLA